MRATEIEVANWLQEVLGSDYSVRYDDCESGLTRVVFKPLHKVIAEVPNSEMRVGISASNYMASKEDRYRAIAIG